MKNDKWIVYLIVGFTSITTVLLLWDGTVFGAIRGVIAAIVLDGLISYWDIKRVKLLDEKQRSLANGMMWAGVGMLLLFGVAYAIKAIAPVDAVHSQNIFGYTFTSTLKDFIFMLAASMIACWIVLTLAVVLYLRQIDPEIKAELERTKADEEAEKELRRIEAQSYKTAMKVASKTVGTEKGLKSFRNYLQSTGDYSEYEINQMVDEAKQEIQISRNGGIVNSEPAVNRYQAETGNPTSPSTQKK